MKRHLIVVDVQNDFCPGGSLAVADADRIIPNINKLMTSGIFDVIIATQDWHPDDHISFEKPNIPAFSQIDVSYGKQIVWPRHCVMGTRGADFRPSLDTRPIHFIVRKGYRKDVDSYSAFIENDRQTKTGIVGLIERGCEIYIAGIATDVCVLNTAFDAIDHGHVFVIEDACAGVTPEGTKKSLKQMSDFGIKIVKTKKVLKLR